MTDRLEALKLFSRVARTGSFSRTARDIGLSQPSVSRIMAWLEADVGAPLLLRTSRAVRLTEAGTDYLARVEPILAALDEADHAARGTGELRGTLRVGVATSFCMRGVLPLLGPFMRAHPALRVELVMSDGRQDLIQEQVDLVIRFGELADSHAVARRLGTTRRLLVTSPAYLAQRPAPQHPDDLTGHDLIMGPAAMARAGWSFTRDGLTVAIRPQGRLQVTVNEVATAAAVAGLGILSTGDWGCRPELDAGSLVQVLEDWEMESDPVHALFVAGAAVKPAARALSEHLVAGLRTGATGAAAPAR